jgi:hypothetical protein
MCAIGNSVHIKLVFQFHRYILQQMELPLYTNNLCHRTVCKVHKWMAYNVDSLQIPSDNVVALLSYVWPYCTIRHTSAFCKHTAIFLTTVLLAANHCNCMCTLRFKTSFDSCILKFESSDVLFCITFSPINFRNCKDHMCSLCTYLYCETRYRSSEDSSCFHEFMNKRSQCEASTVNRISQANNFRSNATQYR